MTKRIEPLQERLLNLIQELATDTKDSIIAVSHALNEQQKHFTDRLNEALRAVNENGSRIDNLKENIENLTKEVAETRSNLNTMLQKTLECHQQLSTAIGDLKKERGIKNGTMFNWKTDWWKSKEFFLIVIIIMLLILLGSQSGVNLIGELSKLFKLVFGGR